MVIVWAAVGSSTAKPHNPPNKVAEKKEQEEQVEKKKSALLGRLGQRESKWNRGEREGSHKRTACVRPSAEGGQNSMCMFLGCCYNEDGPERAASPESSVWASR